MNHFDNVADKTFLLGVGAGKSGTTWLNRYIMNDPAGFTPLFEYHIWDALYGTEEAKRKWIAQRPSLLDRWVSWRRSQSRGYGKKNVIRWNLQNDADRYFDHFASVLSNPSCRIAADITPAYAILPTEVYDKIKEGFAARDIAVKVVFIMRDPVERCWSSVRMRQDKSNKTSGSQEEMLKRLYAQPDFEALSRYDMTIRNLETVFEKEELHFAIFETFFSKQAMDNLSKFTGLAPDYSRINSKENARSTEEVISDPLRREIVQHYEGVYRFCAKRFPEVSKAWPNFGLLD